MAEYKNLCEMHGHDWHLWKAYGKSYMQCSRCPAVRDIELPDLQPLADRARERHEQESKQNFIEELLRSRHG